jgi:NADPH:quinone reductase
MVEPITEARPAQGEVWIEQEAIGVNYLDVTQRNGSVPIALPSGLGLEAAGRVAANACCDGSATRMPSSHNSALR